MRILITGATGGLGRVVAATFAADGARLGLVGTDVSSGVTRYGFGVPELYDGIDFVPVAVGLFGLAEIMAELRGVSGDLVKPKQQHQARKPSIGRALLSRIAV